MSTLLIQLCLATMVAALFAAVGALAPADELKPVTKPVQNCHCSMIG
jgi:hypothetical protein